MSVADLVVLQQSFDFMANCQMLSGSDAAWPCHTQLTPLGPYQLIPPPPVGAVHTSRYLQTAVPTTHFTDRERKTETGREIESACRWKKSKLLFPNGALPILFRSVIQMAL